MRVRKLPATADTSLGDELVASLSEGMAILRGEVAPARVWTPPKAVDVKGIRRKLGLSQPSFASRFGFTTASVRDWEQGRRQPEQAARTLLLVIAHRPDAVMESLLAEQQA